MQLRRLPFAPTATYTYVYGDSNWRDKLTSYNGNTITYDAIGNPISYYNGFTFDWQNGRQLAGVTGNSLTASYKYNSDGIRTSKTVNGVTTEYTLEGSNVVMETNGTDTLWYYYDASGSLTGFELNGTPYFYVKNAQGDIIAITDVSGIKVVEYTYNAWGEQLQCSGSLASTVGAKNPYRYRGYRFEKECGLYYLQSRYYDPFLKRFINADGYVSTGQGVLGNNMFAYCLNNPINYFDLSGKRSTSVSAGIVFPNAMTYGSSGHSPYISKEEKLFYSALKKYNSNSIDMHIGEIGTTPNKLNVTFYPDAALIHIESSYAISDKYEKLAVIYTIMNSECYDATVYSNSVSTMLIEWSGHNFVYHASTLCSLFYDFFVFIGYETPIESTEGVDFRKSLEPSAKRKYEIVTLWGELQW